MAGSENSFWTAPLTQHPSLVTRRRGCDIPNLAGAAFLTRTAGFRACRQFADQLVSSMSARVKSGQGGLVDWSGRKQTSVCKPNCKPTVQHSMIRDITNRDHRIINAKSEHTLNHWTAQANTRILELETVVRVTVPWVRIPPSPPSTKKLI